MLAMELGDERILSMIWFSLGVVRRIVVDVIEAPLALGDTELSEHFFTDLSPFITIATA
jgi:hypothetical protein